MARINQVSLPFFQFGETVCDMLAIAGVLPFTGNVHCHNFTSVFPVLRFQRLPFLINKMCVMNHITSLLSRRTFCEASQEIAIYLSEWLKAGHI